MSHVVQNRRTIGVDRFDLGVKRLGRLAPFAKSNAVADAGPQLIVHRQLLGLPGTIAR